MIRLEYTAIIDCDTQPEAEWAMQQMVEANYAVEVLSETQLRATQYREYEEHSGTNQQ